MPTVVGISHVALTVTDLGRARRFWSEFMGLQVLDSNDNYCALLTRSPTSSVVILTTHESVAADTFTEFSVGLDHLSLEVTDVGALTEWRHHLDAHSVPHDYRRSEWGHHVNLRDPDNIAIELVVLEPDEDVQAILGNNVPMV